MPKQLRNAVNENKRAVSKLIAERKRFAAAKAKLQAAQDAADDAQRKMYFLESCYSGWVKADAIARATQ